MAVPVGLLRYISAGGDASIPARAACLVIVSGVILLLEKEPMNRILKVIVAPPAMRFLVIGLRRLVALAGVTAKFGMPLPGPGGQRPSASV